jgi:uncharacterized protein HemX
MLRDEQGGVSLILSQKPCPKCGAPTTQLNETKPPLPIQIITAVRDADLSPVELLELADAVRDAPAEMSPRQLAEQVPAASKIITIASRAGDRWIELLAVVLAAVAFYVQHVDAQQAHRDAQQAREEAHQDAERARQDSRQERREARKAARTTGSLSDEDIRKIAHQIEAHQDRDSGP